MMHGYYTARTFVLFSLMVVAAITSPQAQAQAASTAPQPQTATPANVHAPANATATVQAEAAADQPANNAVTALRGTVYNADGAPLAYARVVVGGDRETLTDEQGRYSLEGLAPSDSLSVEFSHVGWRTERQQLRLEPAATAVLDARLHQDLLDMEQVVITGTRVGQDKIKSSSAITTMSAAEVEKRAPQSTAALLQAIPGFYVESSGGEVGNNLFARGLPADGSYRYVALMEDGMPVFDSTELFFVNSDIFVRVDENLQRVEALRGGNSALFGSNAPGGVINFISKTGGPTLAGKAKITTGTDGLYRFDGNVNGPLSLLGDKWKFNVGGFYRYDEGLRNPGFAASHGGQIKANITRELAGGYVRLSGKFLNDHNMFLLPIPMRGKFNSQGRLTSAQRLPGFPLNGTLTTSEGVDTAVPLPGGATVRLPLDDGQMQIGGSAMAEIWLPLANQWEVENKLRYVNIYHTSNAMVPTTLLSGASMSGAGQTLSCSQVEGAPSFGSAGCQSPGDYVVSGLQWYIKKPLQNLSNQLQLTRRFGWGGTEHALTLGSYLGWYRAGNTWYMNDYYSTASDQPHLLDVAQNGAQLTSGGYSKYLSNYVNGSADVFVAAAYVGDQIDVTEKLRLDIGMRFEENWFRQSVEQTDTFDLGGATAADDAVIFGTGKFSKVNVHLGSWAASVGGNYAFTEGVAAYARASRGYKMPIADQYLFARNKADASFPDKAEELWQGEMGLKLGAEKWGLTATAYAQQLENFLTQDVRPDPVTQQPTLMAQFVGQARTVGGEIEAVARPVHFFQLATAVTLQEPKYTKFREDLLGDLHGKQVRRIPKLLMDATATFFLKKLVMLANWNYVGHRYSNNANTLDIPGFSVVNAGASYDLGAGLTLGCHVYNLLNGMGLTERNPRLDETQTRDSDVFLARPILPRRVIVSLSGTL